MVHLEVPEKKHEESFLKMIKEFVDNEESPIPGQMELKEWENYEDFLTRIEGNRDWNNIKPWRSPASLFFIVDDCNEIVGWISVRHILTESLAMHSWHIWYGIRPSERRKWYASEALKLALEEAKKLNINPVMLTCRKDNIGSAKTIMKNWWKLECEYEREEELQLKWWIQND